MFQKLIKKALFGFALLACINTPSYAGNNQVSVMKVVMKSTLDGGVELGKRVIYIVKNPASTAGNAFYLSKTVAEGVITKVGELAKNVWGYLVEEIPGVEVEGEGGGESGGESESVKPSYIFTAIEKATESVVGGAKELLVTTYNKENDEPVTYSVESYQVFDSTKRLGNMVTDFAWNLCSWAIEPLPSSGSGDDYRSE